LTAVIVSFFISTAVYMMIGLPFISDRYMVLHDGVVIYGDIVRGLPGLYLLMLSLQFGMVIAACSSLGLLYSTYQPDSFICIGVSGLVFFLWLSASGNVLNMTPFNLHQLLTMSALPGTTNPNQVLTYAWGMMLPLIIIVLCCMLFEKRMKWRAENGIN